MASKRGSTRENVRVVCRIRPTNQKEISSGGVNCVKFTDSAIEVAVDDGSHTFSFDRIFGPESVQVEVFDYTATPLVTDVLSGYNATIFAYGQTGTGKTHTMEGDIHDNDTRGIIPRAVGALFDGVLEADENIEFTFKVSYVEIYMEKIRDLLDMNRVKNNLTVREDKVKGIYIAGVTEEYVTSHDELLAIMASGALNRAVAATGMNEGSSRSHSVFTITVSQKNLTNNTTTSGKLVLVDLAGSEMVRKSNASGQQLEEAKTINKSLSALGQVIYALTDEKQTHVPYRDSKLTRILQDSLGGNAKTVLIVAVSPSSFNANETVSTLRFGLRAKSIENKVTVNQTRSVEELEGLLVRAEKAIDAQAAHIAALTTQIQALQLAVESSGGVIFDVDGVTPLPGPNAAAQTAALSAAEAARQEAETVMIGLQESVNQLTSELDEERAESGRKESELTALSRLLKEKERLLLEAGELLQEAQRHYEGQRERSEQLLRERSDAVGELENLRSQMVDEKAKAQFNLQELEVTVETLRQENRQLQEEVAEMSGDAVPTTDRKSKVNENQRGAQTGIQFGEEGNPAEEAASRSLRAKDMQAKLSALFSRFNVAGDAAAEINLLVFSSGWDFSGSDGKGVSDRTAADQTRRLRDMEVQRSRLEKDLAAKTEKLSRIEFELDALRGMDGVSASEYLSERERAHMRSLQQRLEQLVVVHRQLLRKFASLELENGEFRKKILLRDERIRQLENNSRGLTGNMRQQAERHVAELTNLREQIQLLRTEHYQRMEAKEAAGAFRDGSRRTLRGGAGGSNSGVVASSEPKSMRGGGLTRTHALGSESLSAAAAAAGLQGGTGAGAGGLNRAPTAASGMFSRFLGQK